MAEERVSLIHYLFLWWKFESNELVRYQVLYFLLPGETVLFNLYAGREADKSNSIFKSQAYVRSQDDDNAEEISAHEHDKICKRQRIRDHAYLDQLVSIVTIKEERILQVAL